MESRWTSGFCRANRDSRANGINASGQVVGFSGLQRDSLESHAFVWSSQTGMMDIGTLGGAYVASDMPMDDAGYVTGASQTQGMGPMVTTDAFTIGWCCAV